MLCFKFVNLAENFCKEIRFQICFIYRSWVVKQEIYNIKTDELHHNFINMWTIKCSQKNFTKTRLAPKIWPTPTTVKRTHTHKRSKSFTKEDGNKYHLHDSHATGLSPSCPPPPLQQRAADSRAKHISQ